MTAPDPAAVRAACDELNAAMTPCAGGVEIDELTADGVLRLRFVGMCTGCGCRPLTTARTVRPLLAAVDGVRSVEVAGSRISEEAEERLARAFAADGPSQHCAIANRSETGTP